MVCFADTEETRVKRAMQCIAQIKVAKALCNAGQISTKNAERDIDLATSLFNVCLSQLSDGLVATLYDMYTGQIAILSDHMDYLDNQGE